MRGVIPRPTRYDGWPIYLFCLVILLGASWLFATFYSGHGWFRLLLLGLLLLCVLALRRVRVARRSLPGGLLLQAVLAVGLLGLGLYDARTLVWAIEAAHVTGRLRLDEGRTTLRAAQLLWRGENPYAVGALVDDTAFLDRIDLRSAVGVGPTVPRDQVEAALTQYLATLDPATRAMLLPPVAPGEATPANATARREVAVLGYKYGPVPLLTTFLLEPLAGPASVPLANGLACFALFAVLGGILLRAGAGVAAAGVAVAEIMLDAQTKFYFIFWTATDVWPLLFGFVGVLLALRGRHGWLGVAVALALCSKILPGALFLLLLPVTRSWRAVASCAAVTAVLLLPWLALDAYGFVHNVALWATLIGPDANSWVSSAPPWLVLGVRVALLLPIGWIAWRIAWRQERHLANAFALLAMLLIAGGSAMHNNYIPWFSTWIVLAIAEAVCLPRPLIEIMTQPGDTIAQPLRQSVQA